MVSSLGGSLGEQLLPDILREIAAREMTGFLRLSRDRTTRSLVFEHGRPINACSSIPSEQLDNKLIREGRTTAGLVSAVKRLQPDPMALAQALVDKGLVTADAMQRASQELATQIALSLFDWCEGSYAFEERTDLSWPRAIDLSAADLVAEGVRTATKNETISNAFAPPERVAAPIEIDAKHFASSARLTSIESYVLSVITKPTRLVEVAALTGLPTEQVQPALCVLTALGLLSLSAPAPASNESASDETLEFLLQGVERKLRLFETADYYQVLGVDKLETSAAIDQAFEQLEQMFESYAIDYPDHIELNNRLTQLFSRIRLAHDTLIDPEKRSRYDRSLGPSLPSPSVSARRPVPIPVNIPSPVRPATRPMPEAVIERGQTPPAQSRPAQLPARKPIPIPEIQIPVAPKTGTGTRTESPESARYSPPISPRTPAGPMTRPPAVLSPEEASRLRDPGNGSRVEQALHFYRQGRARFERRELDAAEHLFREAVRLDPSQSQYHFNLAIVLSIRAHARHEHMHHEGCHVTCKLGGSLVSNPKVRYEAEQHLLKACELDPTNAQIPLKLGQLYKEARLNKKAEQYLKQALTLDSRNSVAQQELESLYEIEQNDELQVAQ